MSYVETARTRSTRLMSTFSAKVVIIRQASWSDIAKAHPENVMAPVKLGYAVRMLQRRGHIVTLIDTETGAHTQKSVDMALRHLEPDVVVLHGITPTLPSLFRTARMARQIVPNALIVASGQHATARPQDFFQDDSPFDCAAQYEYEDVLADLVDSWTLGELDQVRGLALPDGRGGVNHTESRELREDLDDLPFPSHELFMRDEYQVFHPTSVTKKRRWGFLMSSRGCPYPCLYCSPTLRNSYGQKMRYRSPESVCDEIEILMGLGATVLHFKDDIFTVSHERTVALCEEIIRRGIEIAWTVQTRADCVNDEVLQLMRRAGCCTVSYGIESGSPRILKVLRKKETVEDAIHAAEATRRAGLHMVNFYLLGNPTETLAEMQMTLDLAKRLDPDLLQVGFFTPYPGSPYYQETFWEKDDHSPDAFSHYNKIINVSDAGQDELRAFQSRFYQEMIIQPRFASRFLRNRLRGLPSNLSHELRFFSLSARFMIKSVMGTLTS